MYRYPLAKDTWDNEEIEAINEVIRSKRYTMGPKVREFEQKFADYFGSKYAVMVNSGSSANLLAVASLVYSGRLIVEMKLLCLPYRGVQHTFRYTNLD